MSNRPQSRGGMNMPSQAGRGMGGRPPSGARMGTSQRMGTAQRDANGQPLQSVGLSTNVVVDNRPVTRQGLTGMQTKPLGPGRRIADDKYFINELRTRIVDITREIESLKTEGQQIETDKTKYEKLTRQYETRMSEVKRLEGDLADFNLAADKMRTNTSVEDLKEAHNRLKQRNIAESKKVDAVFVQTQNTNNKMEAVKGEINKIYESISEKVASMGPQAAQQYRQLQTEQASLSDQVNEKETQIHSLDSRITALNTQLQSAEYRVHQQGIAKRKMKNDLMGKKMQLEEDTDSSLTPEQMKEKLIAKVKETNDEVEKSEKRIKELGALVDRYHNQIGEKERQLQEAKVHAKKARKYDAVYERDRKMQEFLDEFPSVFQEENSNKAKLKQTVVALMRHISQQLATAENLPDASQLSEMKGELSFKEQKLKNSKSTLTHLESDLALRKEELQKIVNLDKKIRAELVTLKDKIKSMNIEMSQFKSDAELKQDATEAKKKLLKEKLRTKKLRESSQFQVQIYGQAYKKRKKELGGNETMKRIDALEQKLRTYSSTVFSLQDFIDSRKRESDYASIRSQVNDICAGINKNNIEQINSKYK